MVKFSQADLDKIITGRALDEVVWEKLDPETQEITETLAGSYLEVATHGKLTLEELAEMEQDGRAEAMIGLPFRVLLALFSACIIAGATMQEIHSEG